MLNTAPPAITLDLSLSLPTAVRTSPRVMAVAAMFGLGLDDTRVLPILPPTQVTLPGAGIVFITGPSGSGKSTLLRLIENALQSRDDVTVVKFDSLTAPDDQPLVDALGGELELPRVMELLSLAGLGDAFVMLRSFRELSDGQRYRFRLALAMARASCATPARPLQVILADELGATLDRVTAAVIARNLRKWTRRHPRVCFVGATTHDDLLEPMEPDVLIEKQLGQGITILMRENPCNTSVAVRV